MNIYVNFYVVVAVVFCFSFTWIKEPALEPAFVAFTNIGRKRSKTVWKRKNIYIF